MILDYNCHIHGICDKSAGQPFRVIIEVGILGVAHV